MSCIFYKCAQTNIHCITGTLWKYFNYISVYMVYTETSVDTSLELCAAIGIFSYH